MEEIALQQSVFKPSGVCLPPERAAPSGSVCVCQRTQAGEMCVCMCVCLGVVRVGERDRESAWRPVGSLQGKDASVPHCGSMRRELFHR